MFIAPLQVSIQLPALTRVPIAPQLVKVCRLDDTATADRSQVGIGTVGRIRAPSIE
jgi:hypothetical protein